MEEKRTNTWHEVSKTFYYTGFYNNQKVGLHCKANPVKRADDKYIRSDFFIKVGETYIHAETVEDLSEKISDMIEALNKMLKEAPVILADTMADAQRSFIDEQIKEKNNGTE